jgi:two-component system, chemotaxis family, protein-glutamate methylesterase/glutaminase
MSELEFNVPVKVLIADDSAFMRTALSRMIESDRCLRVVGTAQTGLEAIEKIRTLQPDVVTLDIDMPGLNGIETLKRVMAESPRPVIMVSSLTQAGAESTVEALGLGAFDYIPKQLNYISLDIIKVQDELVTKIKAAARSRHRGPTPKPRPVQPAAVTPAAIPGAPTIVAIGTSTGGPKALQEILPALPANLPAALLVVQHMPIGFTGPFAKRLNTLCHLTVHEAEAGMPVQPGHVYLAAAGKHMTVHRSASEVVLLAPATPSNVLHMPSVDVMMLSVAEVFESLAMGIIMTGMGADGSLGMEAIFRKGGLTLGQDEATCAVYGMPRSCAELGILRRVVPLPDIPRQILFATGYYKRN